MSRNFIVYQSRNRFTGTLMQTLDTKHADSTIPFSKDKRYRALCVEHKTQVAFAEHYPAGRAIAHPDEWCKKCQAMIAKGTKLVNKKDMKTGPETAKEGRPDLRMVEHNNAHDKKWRNGKVKRDESKEGERKADQAGIYTGKSKVKKENDAKAKKARNARKPGPVTTVQPPVEVEA